MRSLRTALLALGAAPSHAREPARPDLPGGADVDDWEPYYDRGGRVRARAGARRAAAA